MRNYILRRLLLIIPSIIIISMIVFSLIRILPGDVVDLMMADPDAGRAGDKKSAEVLRARLGLDKPIYMQYLDYMSRLARGDLGISVWSGTPAMDEILNSLPVTLELAVVAVLISASIAIPSGVISALRQDTATDYIARVASIIALSVPGFFTGTLIILLPAIWWHYSPPITYTPLWESPWTNLRQMLPPAFALGAISAGVLSRMMRATMLEVLRQDYMRTAWAKGLRNRVVISRHALKNAMIPVVTIMGLEFAALMGGSVIMEIIFTLPGLGRLTIWSIFQRDYGQLQGNILFIATFVLFVNLFVDIVYAWFDPRVHYR